MSVGNHGKARVSTFSNSLPPTQIYENMFFVERPAFNRSGVFWDVYIYIKRERERERLVIYKYKSTYILKIHLYTYKCICQLVVSTPLKNISENGNLPQIGVKIKNV